jgi:hypothetical protein
LKIGNARRSFFQSRQPIEVARAKRAIAARQTPTQADERFATPPGPAALATMFKGAARIPVERVEAYVNDWTSYLRKHMGEGGQGK